ncbi:MAG: nitroreductase [Opitutae bacterium]
MSDLIKSIIERRTSKPNTFFNKSPDPGIIRQSIEIARNAPNHHRTEPARFYLLDSKRIETVGQLFGEIVAGDRTDPHLVERGKKKASEWGNCPGLLIVTCHTDQNAELIQKKPAVVEEDYATCCCICQNLLLLLEKEGISSKWSTGPVWEHPHFAETIGLISPKDERVVALIFYGYSENKLEPRTLTPINQHLVDYL